MADNLYDENDIYFEQDLDEVTVSVDRPKPEGEPVTTWVIIRTILTYLLTQYWYVVLALILIIYKRRKK